MILPVFAFLTTIAIGIVAALAGFGGSFLYVPLPHLDLRPRPADGRRYQACHHRVHLCCRRVLLCTAAGCRIIPGIIGAALGSVLTTYIDTHILVILFVLVLLLIAIQMLRQTTG